MSETQLALTDRPDAEAPAPRALTDLRSNMMSLTPEQMQQALAQYSERRNTIREWLLGQLVEGIHFGFVPGTAPKYDDAGNLKVWNNKKSQYDLIPPEQWKAKPSLYKAGADFVCDLMYVRDEYKADLDAWKQLGEPKGTFVMACYLYSRTNGQLLGEGRGVRKVGQKGGDENNAIKMAKKCAKVDAVLNVYGLADLFTQDIEDFAPQQHENPEHDPSAPQTAERARRMTAAQLKALLERWKRLRPEAERTVENWRSFVHGVCKREFNVQKPDEWTADDAYQVDATIGMEESA